MHMHRFLLPAVLVGLGACTIHREVDPPVAYRQALPQPVYSQASPYAPATTAYRPADRYCAEAVGEAQDAAAEAAATGRGRDLARADRTVGFTRRDCR